jgi:hypothetical protein
MEGETMTDKELLELAAKAAGLEVLQMETKDCLAIKRDYCNHDYWNPLTDDGDALRLAVKLGVKDYFGIEVQSDCAQVCFLRPWEETFYEEFKTQDPYAAARRAIVRAAAEIGATNARN